MACLSAFGSQLFLVEVLEVQLFSAELIHILLNKLTVKHRSFNDKMIPLHDGWVNPLYYFRTGHDVFRLFRLLECDEVVESI